MKETEPQYTAWQAVATLEQKRYTKSEIAATLREVANSVEPSANRNDSDSSQEVADQVEP